MIRISQLKMSPGHTIEALLSGIQKELRIPKADILEYKIVKKSVDARKKDNIHISYSIDVAVKNEQIIKKVNNKNVTLTEEVKYQFVQSGDANYRHRPVIVGTGPAGLFCGLILAENGYKPILIERGDPVDVRVEDVANYWAGAKLKANSNVQFGEGGAGTFSDGKLNTAVKDTSGRNKKVLESFVAHGAPEEICYLNKPHIGTDYLRTVVKNMREHIIKLGGEVRFGTTLTDLHIVDNQLVGIEVNGNEHISCEILIPAIGHSARDTFQMFYDKGLTMEAKSFAIGVRIEHPQSLINRAQYNDPNPEYLPVADYKLTYKSDSGRGVYSFCMCPGGYVVNAASELGGVVTNGMSNFLRDAKNANSAIIVSVSPKDYGSDHPLAGIWFQQKWERLAYEIAGANYSIPYQRVGDFMKGVATTQLNEITPSIESAYALKNLHDCLPDYVVLAIQEALPFFEKKIKGFNNEEALLAGVETRTSSPLRIIRDTTFESNIRGIYPCGEGAGYAGGITSAAMDGIKIAEEIGRRFRPTQEEI